MALDRQLEREGVGTAILDEPALKHQPGCELTHYCATHGYDQACLANPEACRGYCGYRFTTLAFDTTWTLPSCVVCDEMEARRHGCF